MAKLKEEWRTEGDNIVIKETHDYGHHLHQARMYRDAGVGQTGEHRLAGYLPMELVADWIREAGLKWDDTEACEDLIKKKMMSGEFDKFRVWEGKW